MELNNLSETMERIRKIYTCEVPMFDEDGDDWTDEYSDFYDSFDDLKRNPGYFEVDCIPKLMELFDDTLNYDTLMAQLADLILCIARFYGNEGMCKLLESFGCVKENGRMYGKLHLTGGLLANYFEDLKAALLVSGADVRQEFKGILSAVQFEDLLDKKEELLKMLS